MFTSLMNKLGWYSYKQLQTEKDKALALATQESDDRLASELFYRGGFATMQLNPNPGHIPRIRFIDQSNAVALKKSDAAKYGFVEK